MRNAACRASRLPLAGCLLGLLSTGALPAPLSAAEPEPAAGSNEQQSSLITAQEAKELRASLKALQNELEQTRQSLVELRKSLAGESRPSEFSPVRLRIQSESGKPLAGYRVEMESAQKQTPRVLATGRSGEDGLLLERQLPYGDYRLKISEPSGWSTELSRVTVELGAPLDKVIVAPDPSQRAKLRIEGTLNAAAVEGLRFGERRESQFGGELVSYSPEPGATSGRFQNFPTVGRGVTEVGVELKTFVTQRPTQPGGGILPWLWSPPAESLSRVLLSSARLATIEEVKSGTAQPIANADFFQNANIAQPEFLVRYLELKLRDQPRLELELPAGTAFIQVEQLLGKADAAVVEALGIQQPGDLSVWLPAKLPSQTRWLHDLLDRNDWRSDSGHPLARRSQTLRPGESARVRVSKGD